MTYTIQARNVNHAYATARSLIANVGIPIQTRNGPAYRATRPVITTYLYPSERVLFDPGRDANPFFHFFESLWILAGRNDVRFLAYLNGKMAQYSDDGFVFHGAYGWRLRHAFGFDQLERAIRMLRENPSDRRVMLSIWSPERDLGTQSADIPCNDMIKLDVVPNPDAGPSLQLTVFNRSNDILWGCYGANAVQFAFLQEYLAAQIGVRVGLLHQVSTDWHWYGALPSEPGRMSVLYEDNIVAPTPLVAPGEDPNALDGDLRRFFHYALKVAHGHPISVEDPQGRMFHLRFFSAVAWPLWLAWVAHKKSWIDAMEKPRDLDATLAYLRTVEASDWRYAAQQWVLRRNP